MMAEVMDQDLRLIEPRCMNRGKARTPPSVGVGEVVLSIACSVTGIAILNQKYAFQTAVSLAETFQRLNIMRGVFFLHDYRLHVARVNDQEYQDVDGPMACVFKLLLLDRTGNRTADRRAFQDLVIGDLIDADIPQPLLGQAIGMAVAPQHFLGPLFELGIPARRFPIARAMRLQIHLMQNPANRRHTDSGHNLLGDRLPRQILARPMGDVQPFRHRLKTGQLDNLRPLQGGNPQRSASALRPFYHTGHTGLLITAAHSPDRARITVQLRRYRLNPFAGCDCEHDPCMLDLIPGAGLAACHLLQQGLIVRRNLQYWRFATTHEMTSTHKTAMHPSIITTSNFLHYL